MAFPGFWQILAYGLATMQLRQNPKLKSPTVLVVVDRIDLNSQISATFNNSNVSNVVITDSKMNWNAYCSRTQGRS